MRIVISGTYSTGKTTVTDALHYLTGVTRTNARTMRELMPEALPGKVLEQCSISELMELCLWRYKDRILSERQCGDAFISDGSCLHEWVYARARLKDGVNPGYGPITRFMSNTLRLPYQPVYNNIFDKLIHAVECHAKDSYDEFVHLPIEFPIQDDGHRPVSETFRRRTEKMLLGTLDRLKIPYRLIGGSLPERLTKIMEIYGFPQVMEVDKAIALSRNNSIHIEQEVSQRKEKYIAGMGWPLRTLHGLKRL